MCLGLPLLRKIAASRPCCPIECLKSGFMGSQRLTVIPMTLLPRCKLQREISVLHELKSDKRPDQWTYPQFSSGTLSAISHGHEDIGKILIGIPGRLYSDGAV